MIVLAADPNCLFTNQFNRIWKLQSPQFQREGLLSKYFASKEKDLLTIFCGTQLRASS